MKKSSSLTEEFPLSNSSFYGLQNSFEDQEFLLFISDPENNRIKGLNQKGKSCFGRNLPSQESCFFENVIHQEDYPRFLQSLDSCSNAAPENDECRVRLLTNHGEWREFEFKHRQYLREDFGQKQHILSVARQVDQREAFSYENKDQKDTYQTALQESRNKYQILLNSIDEAFATLEIIFDLQEHPIDYLFIETNPAFEQHANVREADGKTIRELIPEFEEHWLTTYGNVALTEKPIRFHGFSGQIKNTWFDVYAFPIGEKDNKKVGLIFSDITEKKMAEGELLQLNESLEQQVQQRTQELKENAELLQTIFDTANQGIVVLKPLYDTNGELEDFLYLRVNKVIIEQYNRTDLEGERYLSINPDSTKIGIFQVLKNTMLTGKFEDFELHYDRNGYNSWFRITARRQNGLLITSLEDISKRKKEAQRLKENIRFKKHLSRTSPDIIMIFNLYEENIQYINRGLSKRSGMKKEEVQGRNLMEVFHFIHPRERKNAMEFHQKIINGSNDDIAETEFRLRGPDRSWEWMNAVGKVFNRNKKGNVYEYMVLLRNVDEQKKTQKALLRAEKLSITGEVARTLAHELRNPLASIGMAADILRGSLPEENREKLENYIKIIGRSTKVLNNLVTDLLTSSNYTPAVLKKDCLAAILEESLKLAGDRIYLTGIKMVKDYKGPYHINADNEKLKIALLNIIINASEAMDPDAGVLRIKINKQDNQYILSIRDNGIGLEKDQLDKLFDAFYTKKAEGMGVGLSSVKNILEEHDARIEVDSVPGKGTHFELSFHCYEVFETT